ncbi:MAG: anthranilate phosphoribosyltransferase, partial [Nitrospirae bacterium]|nr:anthranilate phosphoribosyltransferase [Nitrospirota bacterium]
DLIGGTPDQNGRILLDILGGQKGPRRDVVLLNAAPAIVAAGKTRTLQDGIHVAAESIDSGAALEKLNRLRAMTHRP